MQKYVTDEKQNLLINLDAALEHLRHYQYISISQLRRSEIRFLRVQAKTYLKSKENWLKLQGISLFAESATPDFIDRFLKMSRNFDPTDMLSRKFFDKMCAYKFKINIMLAANYCYSLSK